MNGDLYFSAPNIHAVAAFPLAEKNVIQVVTADVQCKQGELSIHAHSPSIGANGWGGTLDQALVDFNLSGRDVFTTLCKCSRIEVVSRLLRMGFKEVSLGQFIDELVRVCALPNAQVLWGSDWESKLTNDKRK